MLISASGVKQLESLINKDKHQKTTSSNSTSENQEIVEFEEQTFKLLNQQLKIKDEQIAELNERLKNQQQLSADLQQKLDQNQKKILETKKEQPKSFWKRIFG